VKRILNYVELVVIVVLVEARGSRNVQGGRMVSERLDAKAQRFCC